MQQKIAHTYSGLLALSADAIAGDTKNTATVTLAYNNAAAITANRTAAELASNAHGAGVTALRSLKQQLRGAVEEARVFATLARDVLKPQLGRQFNTGWVETGFERNLQIPAGAAQVETMVERLAAYFEANPGSEATSSGVTAAAAEGMHSAVSTLRQSVKSQATTVRTLKRQRREKFQVLRKQILRLVRELGEKLSPLDERWLDYGLAIPGIKQKPPTPQKVTPMVMGPNSVALQWAKVSRAEYYRVWLRTKGSEEEMTPAATVQGLTCILENLAANSTFEIAVSAVNNGGESALSEVVEVSLTTENSPASPPAE